MRMVKLGEVATVERTAVSPEAIDHDSDYLGLEHIEKGGRILDHPTAGSAELRSTKFRYSGDHILYGKLRPYLAKIALPTTSGVCSTDILPILPGPQINKSYLAHYLRQNSMVEFANSRATGANLPRLSPKQLEQFPVPLPSLREQRRIAAILDQADAIRTKRRQVIERLDALPQQAYHERFGQLPATLTVEELAVAEKGSIRTGPFGSQLLHSEFVDAGIAVLGLDNVVGNIFTWGERRYITYEKYEKLKRYTVNGGDVLISIMGTTGRCVVVPNNIPTAINTKHICAITPDVNKIHPDLLRAAFLWHPESRSYLRRQTKGAIMDGLNMGIIKGMPVPDIPIDQQSTFADLLGAIEADRSRATAAMQQDDALFTSLQSRAFKGEL